MTKVIGTILVSLPFLAILIITAILSNIWVPLIVIGGIALVLPCLLVGISLIVDGTPKFWR